MLLMMFSWASKRRTICCDTKIFVSIISCRVSTSCVPCRLPTYDYYILRENVCLLSETGESWSTLVLRPSTRIQAQSSQLEWYSPTSSQRLEHSSPRNVNILSLMRGTLVTRFIIWPCLTRTGNYQIREFDWLKSILTAV